MLHGGPWVWCRVIVALELHSSALRMYDHREATELTVRPAGLEDLHLSAMSGTGGTALYLHGTVVSSSGLRFRRHYGGDAFRLVMPKTMAPWLRAFCTTWWTLAGHREKFADAWCWWVEGQFRAEGMLHLPVCHRSGHLPVRSRWRRLFGRQHRCLPHQKGLSGPYGHCGSPRGFAVGRS